MDDPQIDLPIEVDDPIPEPRHPAERLGEGVVDNAGLLDEIEGFSEGSLLA